MSATFCSCVNFDIRAFACSGVMCCALLIINRKLVFFVLAKKQKKKTKGSKVKTGIVAIGALAVIGAFVPEEDVQETSQEPPAIEETIESEQPTIEETVAEVIEKAPPQESEANPPEPASVPEEKEEKDQASAPAVAPEEPEPVIEVDPEQAFRESLKQYFLVGSSESDKYHTPTCRWTKEINDSNLVHFDSYDEAEAANYLPCGTCKPK